MENLLYMMRFLKAGKEPYSFEEFGQVPWMIEEGKSTPELERLLIEAGPNVLKYFNERETACHECWSYHIPEIVDGTFPLERIPAHVRTLAWELYYKDKGVPKPEVSEKEVEDNLAKIARQRAKRDKELEEMDDEDND